MKQINVFVSSAMEELENEREIAIETIEFLSMKPVYFEKHAGVLNPLSESLKMVERSDIVIVIVWRKYSEIVRKEYKKALTLNKPILFIEKLLKEGENRDESLINFIKSIGKRHTYKTFRNLSKLKDQIKKSVQQVIYEIFINTIKKLPNDEIYIRIKEALQRAEELHIFSRTPILLFGPRDYLTESKLPDEKIGYDISLKLVKLAKKGKKKFYLIIYSNSVIEEINKCSNKKRLATIVLENLKKLYSEQTDTFKIACTPPHADVPPYLTYLVADDIVIIWIKTPYTNHCILTENSEIAFSFKHLSSEYFIKDKKNEYKKSLIQLLENMVKGDNEK